MGLLRIVFGSHTHLGGPFVVGSHHLSRELRRLGHDVVHVSTQITPVHALRLRDPVVRTRFRLAVRPDERDGVVNLVAAAALPWSAKANAPWLWSRDLFLPPGGLRHLVRSRLGGPVDLLLLDQPKLVGLARLLRPTRTVYRATDVYSLMKGNLRVGAAERHAVRTADLVVATSEPVAAHLRRLGPRRAPLVLENGVDQKRFAKPVPPPPEYAADVNRARAVYVGALDYRFDFAMLDALAVALPQVEFVLIGPSTARSRERRLADNVTVLGTRPHAAVPAYLQHAHAGLLLMNDDPSNEGRSPMKLYEYGAAGLAVLARSTPEMERRREPFVATYTDAAEAVAGLTSVFRARAGAPDPSRSVSAPTPGQIAVRDWSAIAQTLVAAAFADGQEPTCTV